MVAHSKTIESGASGSSSNGTSNGHSITPSDSVRSEGCIGSAVYQFDRANNAIEPDYHPSLEDNHHNTSPMIRQVKLQQTHYVKLLFAEWDKYIWGNTSHPPLDTSPTTTAEWATMCEEVKGLVNSDVLLKGMEGRGDGSSSSSSSSSTVNSPTNISILTLILSAWLSASNELHRFGVALALQCMSYGPYSAMRIAYGLVQGLVGLCDGGQGLARLTNSSPQYAMLVRYLITMESLATSELPALAMVQYGALEPLLVLLSTIQASGEEAKSQSGLCLVVTQLLTTIFRSLQLLHTRTQPLHQSNHHVTEATIIPPDVRVHECVGWMLHGMATAVARILPLTMAACQDLSAPAGSSAGPALVLWQQSVMMMAILPNHAVRRMIEGMSKTFTLEGTHA